MFDMDVRHHSRDCVMWCTARLIVVIPDRARTDPFSSVYPADLTLLVKDHGLRSHLYDDTQIYGSCNSSSSLELQSQMSVCIDDVASWLSSYRLQINRAEIDDPLVHNQSTSTSAITATISSL